MMRTAALAATGSAARTGWYMVVVKCPETQARINQTDRRGTPRATSEGTVTILIFGDALLMEEQRTNALNRWRPSVGYINVGVIGGYLQIAANTLGYSARMFYMTAFPEATFGHRYGELEYFLEGRQYHHGTHGMITTENMKFGMMVVIGTQKQGLETHVTSLPRVENWHFHDPATSNPNFRVRPTTINLAALANGVYSGNGRGYAGNIRVNVTVANGAITGVDVVEHSETPAFMQMAVNGIIPQILQTQGVAGIDAVSGATDVSNGIINAVTDALSR